MRKFLLALMVILMMAAFLPLSPSTQVQAQDKSYTGPADVLPATTWLYFESEGFGLPITATLLYNMLAADELTVSEILAEMSDTPLSDLTPWLGQRVGGGLLFSPTSLNNLSLFNLNSDNLLDAFVEVFEVSDEDAADAYMENQMAKAGIWEARELADGNIRQWIRTDSARRESYLRMEGYLISGSQRALNLVIAVLEDDYPALSSDPLFHLVKNRFSENPTVWGYEKTGNNGFSLVIAPDAISLEVISPGIPPLERPASAFSSDALQGVPDGALIVATGTDAGLRFQEWVNTLKLLLNVYGELNPEGPRNPGDLMGLFSQMILGADLENEIVPLFYGSHAFYLNQGSAESLLPLSGGLILVPDDPMNATTTFDGLTRRIRQNGFPLTRMEGRQYKVELPGDLLQEPVLGVTGGKIYMTVSETDAEQILATMSGEIPGFAGYPIWNRALEFAPVETQQIIFVNLAVWNPLINEIVREMPEPGSEMFEDVPDYVSRFESLSVFSYQAIDGMNYNRYVLVVQRNDE